MGQTKKRHYDRYTLDFKLQAVKLANNPDVRATHIAYSLGIHVVMLKNPGQRAIVSNIRVYCFLTLIISDYF
jgi:transposase-like protein